MHFLQTVTFATLASVAFASWAHDPNPTDSSPAPAKTIEVKLVAENGVVKYVPDRVDAEIGDVVKFRFFAAAHSATQSTFDKPCTALDHGFDSGLVPNPNNEAHAAFERLFHVQDKLPKWFYCKQPTKNHCGQGMVFGINPNGKMDEFIERAKAQNGGLVNGTPTSPAPAAMTTVVVSGGFNADGSNSLQFNPPFLPKVVKGEKVVFDFRKLNHTLTESTFETPCVKKLGTNIDTDFQNANPDDVPLKTAVTIEFDSDEPRYFYCKQANFTPRGHCGNGMVFAVNVDQGTFTVFRQNAFVNGAPKIKGRSPRPFSV